MRTRISYIDGWRTVAVSLVIASHLLRSESISGYLSAHGAKIWVTQHGFTGVFIFFFISGLVVGQTCLTEIRNTNDFSSAGFYIRRFFRIVPPLMLYLTTCLTLGLSGIVEFKWSDFLSASLYLCNNEALHCGVLAGHTWSLAFEEQFYLIFPIFLTYSALGKRPKIWKVVLLGTYACMPFFLGTKSLFVAAHGLFILGFLVARNWDAITTRFSKASPSILFAASSFLAFVLPVLAAMSDVDQAMFQRLYRLVLLGVIPVLVISSGLQPLICRFLSLKFMGYIGRASYSIYLWQQLVTSDLFAQLRPLNQIGCLIAVIALCLVSFEYLEKPLIAAGRRLSESIAARARTSKIGALSIPK